MLWAEEELAQVNLGDARLDRRLITVIEQLAEHPSQSVPQAFGPAAKAVYRLWDNPKTDDKLIRAAHQLASCTRCFEYPVVLAIQDTTTLDFTGHRAMKGLGYLERSGLRGLLVHSTLVASESGVPLGLVHQKVWMRSDEDLGKKSSRHRKATRKKESQRWLDGLEETQKVLANHPCVITIADREGDIFDLLAAPRSANSHLLIRAAQNRRVDGEIGGLKAIVARAPIIGYEQIRLDTKPERDVRLALRHTSASILPPKQGEHQHQYAIDLNLVLAEEVEPPPGEEPIRWLLLTTLPVTDEEDIRRCLRLYSRRWLIERYHYTLKSGCHIEDLQLETANRLRRALATYCIVAWRLLWLTYLAREDDDQPCTVALRPHEWQALYCATHKTPTPPAKPPSLKQAVRWIAQMGGFLGRKGDGDPGVKVLWRGLQALAASAQLWQILHPDTGDHSNGVVGNG